MGSFLDKPITEKDSHSGTDGSISFGLSSMQGWRVDMEDAHTAELNFPNHPGVSFFAVFDGHGGSTVSTQGAIQLIPQILETEEYKNTSDELEVRLSKGLRAGFFALDRELRRLPKLASLTDRSGSTAVACFITPTHIVFGNCGDSRAVLCRAGKPYFGTADHKPSNRTEVDRIVAAGGFLDFGRVCGNLAVSRALGDYSYKDKPSLPDDKQIICCDADMTTIERHETDEFIILACDGIWDVMSNQDACEFVTVQLKAGYSPKDIAERLLDHCLKKNSKDNMTAVIVTLPAAPAAEPGFVAPPLGPSEDELSKLRQEHEEASAALSSQFNALLNPGGKA